MDRQILQGYSNYVASLNSVNDITVPNLIVCGTSTFDLVNANLEIVDPNDYLTSRIFLAAVKVENEVNTEYPGARIKNFTHQITTFEVEDIAKINVKYRLEGTQFVNAPHTATPTEGEEDGATAEYDLDTPATPGRNFDRNFKIVLN